MLSKVDIYGKGWQNKGQPDAKNWIGFIKVHIYLKGVLSSSATPSFHRYETYGV